MVEYIVERKFRDRWDRSWRVPEIFLTYEAAEEAIILRLNKYGDCGLPYRIVKREVVFTPVKEIKAPPPEINLGGDTTLKFDYNGRPNSYCDKGYIYFTLSTPGVGNVRVTDDRGGKLGWWNITTTNFCLRRDVAEKFGEGILELLKATQDIPGRI